MPEILFLFVVSALGVVALSYICWRGYRRDQFRMIGRDGWYHSKRKSFEWWFYTIINLAWLILFVVMLFTAIYGAIELQ